MNKNKIVGIFICFVIGVISWFLGKLVPVIGSAVFGVLIGIALSFFIRKTPFLPGIQIVSKKFLQFSVILLGLSMNITAILKQGLSSLPIIICTILVSLIMSTLIGKRMKIDYKTRVLIGVGSSICGGSAIAATAPVIEADSDEVAQAISVIFIFNVLAALIFPMLGGLLHLSDNGFAIFAGTAVNDTSSVTAAASTWDTLHNTNILPSAMTVKLTRTLAIIPITLILSLRTNRQKAGTNQEKQKVNVLKLVPMFLILFLALSLVASFVPLPGQLVSTSSFLSKFLITMAMASIGLLTDVQKLIKSGGKAVLLGFICWISIAVTCLLLQSLFGLL